MTVFSGLSDCKCPDLVGLIQRGTLQACFECQLVKARRVEPRTWIYYHKEVFLNACSLLSSMSAALLM